MDTRIRLLAGSTAAAALLLLFVTTAASAHTPVAGAERRYPQDTTLQYKWGGSYPSWFTNAMGFAFGIDWTNSTYSNARLPKFSYSASGAGTVWYTSSTGLYGCDSVDWVGCATATASNANTGNNWSRSFTESGGSTSVTYDYLARYRGETGVDAASSGVVSLTWRHPCPLGTGP